MPKPRSTQRRAAYHKCAARTVRPTCRTGSVTWRGSSTPPPAPPRQRHLSRARRHAAQEPLPRPGRHRSRHRTPRGRKTRQLGQRSLTTPSPETGSATPPPRKPTQPLSPLRRARPHRSIAGSPATRRGQAGPPPHDNATSPKRRTDGRPGSANQRATGPPVKPGNKNAPLTTRQPEAQANAAPSTDQPVEPSSSVRTTGNRQRQAAAKTAGLACPDPATTRESPGQRAVMTPTRPVRGRATAMARRHARDPIEAVVRACSTADDCRGRGVVTHRGRRRGGGAPRQRRPRPGRRACGEERRRDRHLDDVAAQHGSGRLGVHLTARPAPSSSGPGATTPRGWRGRCAPTRPGRKARPATVARRSRRA